MPIIWGYLNKRNSNKDIKEEQILYPYFRVCLYAYINKKARKHSAQVQGLSYSCSECPPPNTRTHTLTAESNYLQS